MPTYEIWRAAPPNDHDLTLLPKDYPFHQRLTCGSTLVFSFYAKTWNKAKLRFDKWSTERVDKKKKKVEN